MERITAQFTSNKAERLVAATIRLGRDEVHRGHLLLVNAMHPVRSVKEPAALSPVAAAGGLQVLGPAIELETVCLRQLAALLTAVQALDDIVVVSGYRSQEEQQAIYEGSIRDSGPEYTASYVALPGRSEHQTGLAVDVGERQAGELDFIAPSFPDHGKCLAFKETAARYGFIQRYQEGKRALTGIACEPWHYRYVGTPHAQWMERLGYCLEEYMDDVKRFEFAGGWLQLDREGTRAAVYYVRAEERGLTEIPLPVCEGYQVSGNNVDGFIVTVYGIDDDETKGR
ncbi:D-alanyl-D-alanine carboxypeptidase family protein [Paenibacillus sp. 1011MAR3C5]|uniref:D-alanyl-D-alanine carboxypeptidase family protein n=1 Tax=Paenibacillus sp. 1011MAR3C5 TaxID=1675787 RepID=UPI000E6D1DE5|nr:D-alanyl-D-alanine carboxypeptidase family protein [Paenibacillus sp. 1011MAR3C5]RJE85577.1 D-alanyl-D-alanine carboxypeptidase family protein [Paenibacillus sp. 1011MAR3C5]